MSESKTSLRSIKLTDEVDLRLCAEFKRASLEHDALAKMLQERINRLNVETKYAFEKSRKNLAEMFQACVMRIMERNGLDAAVELEREAWVLFHWNADTHGVAFLNEMKHVEDDEDSIPEPESPVRH